VLRVDAPANRLVVGRRDQLATTDVALRDVTFIDPAVTEPLRCQVRLRYHSKAVDAIYQDGTLILDEPFLGVAPGQSAVFYEGTRVLGGGVIADQTAV